MVHLLVSWKEYIAVCLCQRTVIKSATPMVMKEILAYIKHISQAVWCTWFILGLCTLEMWLFGQYVQCNFCHLATDGQWFNQETSAWQTRYNTLLFSTPVIVCKNIMNLYKKKKESYYWGLDNLFSEEVYFWPLHIIIYFIFLCIQFLSVSLWSCSRVSIFWSDEKYPSDLMVLCVDILS